MHHNHFHTFSVNSLEVVVQPLRCESKRSVHRLKQKPTRWESAILAIRASPALAMEAHLALSRKMELQTIGKW